jgi:DNA polymerase type B, organellar and viral
MGDAGTQRTRAAKRKAPPDPPISPQTPQSSSSASAVAGTSTAAVRIDNTRRKKRRKTTFVRIAANVKVARSIYNKNYVDYLIENNTDIKNYGEFLVYILPTIRRLLKDEINLKRHIKCGLLLAVCFVNTIGVEVEFAYRTISDLLVSALDIEEFLADQFARILTLVDQRDLSGGSGFRLLIIRHCEVRISKTKLINGGVFIPLPAWVKNKLAVINIQSGDNQCFKHAVFAHHLSENNQRKIGPRMLRRLEKRYDFTGIRFPTPLVDVKRFSKLNNMTINCYGIEKKYIYPILICKEHKPKHLDLLYLSSGKRSHFAWIKNLSRLLSAQVSRHNGRKVFCERCTMHFNSERSLTAHKLYCNREKISTTVLPEKLSVFKFSKFDSCQLVPLIIAADFESILSKISTCLPDPQKSYTADLHSHVAVSFGACLHSIIDTSHVPRLPLGYFGCSSKSERQLWRQVYKYFVRVAKAVRILFNTEFPIKMTAADEIAHEAASVCYVCGQEFTDSNYKVKDHDHFVSENNYRGPCHNNCNLKMRKFQYVPVYFHSLSSYDLHHLLKIFCLKKLQVRVLAVSLEKYITFTVKIAHVEFRFLDSYLMLNDSLKVVSEALTSDKYVETKKLFPERVHHLILKKAPFPYSYLDSADKLDSRCLPDRSFYHCDLTDTPITDAEYARAQEIWDECECTTFGSLLSLYQKSDCSILLDALLSARELYWNNFKLDMCSFLSLAHLSMQCMLKTTGVELELMGNDDPEAFDMARRSLFGGITMSNLRLTECGDGYECLFVDAIGDNILIILL